MRSHASEWAVEDGSDRAKEQRFDPADLFVKFMERLTVPPKIARSERRRSSGSLPANRHGLRMLPERAHRDCAARCEVAEEGRLRT
jgi:hypothetical protein